MNKMGIIQGRLSPRPYPKLQAFPERSWKKEFQAAKDLGFDYIEWIFELDNVERNPLRNRGGRKEIISLVRETGMPVQSVCADFFLTRPFYRIRGYTIDENVYALKELIANTAEIGAHIILLPVLEEAEIRTLEERDLLVSVLKQCVPELEQYGIKLGLETELGALQYRDLCQNVGSSYVGAYYDTGNCAACGYDMAEDMGVLADELVCIHVKDRKLHGESTFLGEGAANLKGGVQVLKEYGYSGGYTLQTYFEEDCTTAARRNLLYMKSLLQGEE